jgi:hypothetical protein
MFRIGKLGTDTATLLLSVHDLQMQQAVEVTG